MKYFLEKWILGSNLVSYGSRLLASFLAPYPFMEILKTFHVDLTSMFKLDLFHYILVSLIFMLVAEIWSIHKRNLAPKSEFKAVPNKDFAQAILMYMDYLKTTHKDKLIVDLRNKLTHLFHILGLNEDREKLGKIAFGSAAVINDNLSKAEILIDDLGWAIHLQKHSNVAKENIEKAIELLNKINSNSEEDEVRLRLAKAKAFRHLAFLSSSNEQQNDNLNSCAVIVDQLYSSQSLMSSFKTQITCDKAQMHHAKAFLAAKNVHLHKTGTISPNDINTLQVVRSALSEINIAISLFQSIGDSERIVKALFLKERLLNATQADIEAIEAKAWREKILSTSGFDESISVIALEQAESA